MTPSTHEASARALPTDVRLPAHLRASWSEFIIGVDALGEDVIFDAAAESPHILISGSAGSGKTETAFALAAQALSKGWKVAICERVTSGWSSIAGQLVEGDANPGVVEHATELYGVRDALNHCVNEMRRRLDVNSRHQAPTCASLPEDVAQAENIRPLLVVIDDALDLFSPRLGLPEDVREENETRSEAESLMQRLIVSARSVSIHVVLVTQRPHMEIVGGAMRSNLGARIACGDTYLLGRQMMFQMQAWVPEIEAYDSTRRLIPGRALVRMAPGRPIIPAQLAWLGRD